MDDVDALLAKRATTHGDFRDHARISQALKALFRAEQGWVHMTEVEREALDAIALKLCRILSGNRFGVDHYRDIAGYAMLVVREFGGDDSV